jgi:AcrR family transcriptional regulator
VSTPPEPPVGLREQRKARTRRAIQEHALRLFLAKGYEATTVDEIASAAGVSHMTFFRYFPTKEAVVETDDYDASLALYLRDRPAGEEPLAALHRALHAALTDIYAADREAILVRTRLVLDTPALRARQWRNVASTERLFARALAERAGEEVAFEHRVLGAATLAALTAAIDSWAVDGGVEDLPTLVARAFGVLAPLHPKQ